MNKMVVWPAVILGGLMGLLVLAVIGLAVFGPVIFERSFDQPVYSVHRVFELAQLAPGENLASNAIAGRLL